MLIPGWKKKALKLRTIVLCSPIVEMDPGGIELFDSMRAFRRGTIDIFELQRRHAALPPKDTSQWLYEPLEVYGWNIHASLYGNKGKVHWLVSVARDGNKAPSEKELVILFL